MMRLNLASDRSYYQSCALFWQRSIRFWSKWTDPTSVQAFRQACSNLQKNQERIQEEIKQRRREALLEAQEEAVSE